jgi:hypothetical protein
MIRMNTLYKAIMDKSMKNKFWFDQRFKSRVKWARNFRYSAHRTRTCLKLLSNRRMTFQQLVRTSGAKL